MSTMAKAFKRMYDSGKISIGALAQAVKDGAITAEEYKEICGEDYPEE